MIPNEYYELEKDIFLKSKDTELVFRKNHTFFLSEIENGKFNVFTIVGKMFKPGGFTLESFVLNKEAKDVLVKSSKKKTGLFTKEAVFKVDESKKSGQENAEIIDKYMLALIEKIDKNNNLSANFEELRDLVVEIKKNIEALKPNRKNLIEKEQLEVKKAYTFFEAADIPEFKNKNVKNKSEPYVYMREIEEVALDWLKDSTYWLQENELGIDLSMVNSGLSDFVDILEVSYSINKGDFKNALKCGSFDTVVRESLPSVFWDEWVIPQLEQQNTSKKLKG